MFVSPEMSRSLYIARRFRLVVRLPRSWQASQLRVSLGTRRNKVSSLCLPEAG